jgi:exodeoxyribonuclease-5
MRRHKIIPFDNHLVLQLFTQRGSDKFKAGWPTENGVTKALKHEILIDNTGVYLKDKAVTDPNDYLSGYTKQDERQIEALKKEFNEVLTQAYTEQDPTPGATFMSYPRQFIENPRLFQTYLGNGKFKSGNYIDFILSQPTIVKIQPTQNDMYNRQIIFKAPTTTSKDLKGNQEISEIFSQVPELASIGTEELYSEYLDLVFPNSKIKDILYHGTTAYKIGDTISDFQDRAFYIGNKQTAKSYAYEIKSIGGKSVRVEGVTLPVIIDAQTISFSAELIGETPETLSQREQQLKNAKLAKQGKGVFAINRGDFDRYNIALSENSGDIGYYSTKEKFENRDRKRQQALEGQELNEFIEFLEERVSEIKAGRPIDTIETNADADPTVFYAALDPNKVLFLGSPKDIEGFKKFMGVDTPTSDEEINIYAGNNENAELSNFAKRPVNVLSEIGLVNERDSIIEPLGQFATVEGAFQAQKLATTYNPEFQPDPSDIKNFKEYKEKNAKLQKLRTATGAQARAIGRSIKGLNVKSWDKQSPFILKALMKASFEQNPQALQELLDTGNATLTHKFKGKEQDGGRFSKLLMEVREELRDQGFYNVDNLMTTSNEQDVTPKENKKQVDKDNDLDTEKGGYGDLFDELERSGDLEADKVTKADIERAEDFWNNSETGKLLSKHISLQKAANLVNSDAYAKFIVSGATLTNPDILGTIKINKAKGSMVDIYHEGFHAFTQLFLSPADKKALYNEVLNFTDTNGNKPYENMDARQIEEMLAEDFRTYMKKAYVKKDSPKRNSIFRRILNFLKALFGKLKSVKVKDVKLDIMSVPAVNELFTNLKSGNKDFLNKYAAKVSNAKFLELDRGITALEKTGRETRKRSILNKQDSDLVSESIDSAISEVIDRIYNTEVKKKKAANQQISPNFKAISLAALLDPKYRSRVYDDVKLQFQERVQELNAEFQDSIGGNTLTDIINSEDPFETLKDSVAGKLIAGTYKDGPKKGKKKTTDKYVLLESQIDSFDNLIPNTKKGQRTAGSSYWGIKIVGNYYTVPGLQDADGRPIEIIVVSDPEDVATQYDNYIDAGSTAYASFMTYNDRAPVLNDEQAVTFNQIRILTTALNNWGTLGDLNKNVAPTGTIAYHIRNSDFEIGKAKYYVADEVDPGLVNNEDVADTEDPLDIDSDTEVDEGSTESLGMNPDLLDGKKSLLQLADKEVVYLLKSLHEIKSIDKKGKITYAKNRLGFRQRANFMKTWNIVSKTIGGVQDRQVAYDLLQKEAESYPVLKQLLDTKLPSPKGLTNSTAFSLNAAFWHTFAKPSAIYKQFTIKEKADKSGYDFYIEDSSPAINSILLKFTADFKSATSPYVNLTTEEQAAMLDSEGLIKKTGREGVKQGMERTFLKALGINIDVTDKLNSVLVSDESEPQLRELASFVTKIADLKANKEKTTAQLNIILKFESDPIDFFKNKDRYIDELKEAGLYEKANEIRVDTAVKYFAGIQAKYGFDSPGEMIKLPDGNMASTVTNHMTLTSLTDGINSLDTLEDAWTLHTKSGYLGHLNPTKNFFINRSKTIDSLFAEEDAEGSRKRIEGSKLDFLAFAGSEIFNDEGSSGKTTSDLTSIDKFYQNLHYMLLGGIVEGSRAAEKNSAFGISPAEKTKIILDKSPAEKTKIILDNGTRSGDNTRLWIDTDKFIPTEFANSVGEDIAIKGFMLDYIAVEFDRIKFFKENPEILETTKGFNKLKSNDVMAGLEFSYLDDMLSDSTKNKLYKLAEPKNEELTGDIKEYILNDADLLKAVTEDLLKYFDTQINDLYNNYLLRTPFELNKTLFGDDMTMSDEEFSSRARGVLSSYYYNSWISRFEQNNLVMGDMAQLDHAKEAGNKRLPGPQSNGTGFLIDEDAQTFVNEVWNKSSYAAKFEKEGIETLTTDGSINVGVVNDPERITLYLKEQEDAWREGYEADGLSEDVIKARLVEDNKKYKEIEEADGHAVITLDAYRMMKKLGGPNEWTAEQESLYQDIINGESIDPKKAARFFPVYKLQYHGPIMNAKINTTMMLKYAVTPISPSWAKLGTEAYKLHKKMMKDNMPMITFGTGSKMGALSFTKGPAFDNIFNESKSSEYTTVNEDAEIAPNKLHLKYFKDVTKVSSKLKKENTLGTQDRVITLDTLYDKGELIEGLDPKLVAEYKKATEGISKIYKTELLERIGYEYINGEYKGNIKRLVSVLRNELELKEIPSQILDMLDVRLNEQLSYDFSVIPVADVIEKTLVNLISKSLVKQKTNGEALVNVPVTLFGGVWEPTWPSEEVKQEALAGNEELIRKFLGTNGLPSYRRGEVIDEATGKRKPTYLAKAAIAFNGEWVNLLNLKFQGKLIGIKDVDGSINMDASLENLNRLIKTDAFLEEHGDKIRIAGPRIPTDAINLKEAFEVWHFLPADAGSQVIVPTEIVAKAGSDFDLDKIFFSYPNIDANGQLPKAVLNFKEQLEILKSENKSTIGLIRQQKRYAQNEWLRTNVNIIRDPLNYGALTKPTSDYLVRGHIEKYYLDRDGSYNPKKRNVHVQEERVTGTRVGEEQNDLEKHRELLGGNRPLGISAKKDKQHALYKSIGAKFPKTYTLNNASGKIERKFVLNFNHEKTKDGNISLSSSTNVDNISISDIFSHGLQGILDRANDSFISKANIVKETLPVLNRLIESGVSFPIALDFINQPLIVEFIEGKIQSDGFISGELNPIYDSDILRSMASKLSEGGLDILENAYKYSNEKRMNEILANLENSKFQGKILIEYMGERKKYNSLEEFKQKFNTDPSKISTLTIKPKGATVYSLVFRKDFLNRDEPSLQSLKERSYYVSEYLWNNYFDGKDATLTELRKNIDDSDNNKIKDKDRHIGQQLAALAHYFQIADQSTGMEQIEIFFNPDTKLVDTLVSVQNREAFIDALELNSKIDSETLQKLLKTSIISSLYESDIFLQLVPGLMPLRTMPKIVNYISNTLSSNRFEIEKRFGKRAQDKDRYISAFNNAIVDYIYQNVMSNYVGDNALPTQLPSLIKKQSGDYSVKSFTGTLAEPIKINDNQISVDLTKLKKIYKGKFFLSSTKGKYAFATLKQDSFAKNQNPFKTFDSFVRYAIEKQILYKTYSEDDYASKLKYESFISERALRNTNNRAYIMGTTKYSFTKKVLATIKKYPHLSFKYPVLLQLSESFQGKRVQEGGATGLSLLELKDKKIITPEQAAEYAKNLEDLGNISIQKSNNKDRDKALKANREISEVFANFSLMMYYQQGVGKSSLSFNKALNGVAFTEIMTNAVNSFMTIASDKNAQTGINEVLNGIRSSILEGKGYKNYLKNASTFLKIEDADLSDTEDTETTSELDKLKAQLEVAKLEQDADSVKSLSEAIRDLESRLAAEQAQGEFPVAPGVQVVSKEYGVTKVNTNPNASTTTSLIALMQPQILAQLYKENKGAFANAMFNYGYRWTRTENAYAPLDITSASTKAGEKEYYAYDTLDQNQNPLPSINTLDPIIKIVENNLGMDMSGYDSAIVNIYEGKEHIYPHKDTSEDVTAEGYPVVVYSMGNDSSLGIWDDNKGKMTFAHKYREPGYGPYKGMKPTNEVLTQNGSIYTFGMNGNGRFALTHTTPTNADRTQDFPPITMPDGRVVTKYTVTVTFRRAAPLTPGMPVKPGRKVLSSETPLTPSDAVATYRQDLVSGIQAYGTIQKANKTAVDLLGPNPTSIDMIDAGIRTRTTRSAAKAGNIRIGDVILHRGKSADGTEKMIYAKVTNIHPKGSEGYKGTWSKEGWTAEGVDNIDRFGDGAMAIEFEVIGNYMSKSDAELIKEDVTQTSEQKEEVLTADELTNHSGGAYGADTFFDSIGRDFNVLNHNHYKSPNDAKVSATLKNQGVEATVLTDKQMDEAYRALDKLTGKTNSRNKINDLLARNYFQVKNADAVYAIARLNERGTDVKGGTSYAVNYAKRMKKPIYVWDINTESWFKWVGKSFVSTETPKLTRNFAGVGSRDLQNYNVLKDGKWVPRSSYVGDAKSTAAKKAIRELYENTLTSSPVPVNSVEVGRFVGYKGNIYIALRETNQGWQIYNPRFEGPNSKLNVKLENLDVMSEKADLVLDDKTNRLYLITPDKNIISLTTGKLMKWAKNNGDRIRILSLVDKKDSEQPPVELNAGQTFTGLTFNEGQADAIKKMKEFLNSDEQEFILEGKAGTGKTTVMKEVLLAYQNSKENRKKTILIGALSWQATNVLDSTLKGKPRLRYDKNSLAGMLNQKMDEITHKMTKATYSTEGRKVGSANLVIIDEASMVNEQHLEILRDQALNRGEDIKIIYLGDRGQLPPIREFTSNENSPVFKIENRAELTERVRQGEESPILPYADLYWNNADNENPVADPANGNRSTVTQQDGQLLFVDDSSAIDITIQEYKKAIESENYDLIKYVTYTNKRRFRVNKEIHREIFGEDAHFYTPTTPVRFNAPYDALENMEEISFINSDQAVVHKIIEQGEDEYGIAFVKLEILTPLSSKPVTITTVDYTKEALKDKLVDNKYNMRLNKLNARYYRIKNDPKSTRAQEKIALNEYLEYKRRYAPISQDYAVTSHKSQGSTYNTVIVDEVDIYNVKALTPKVRSNSMYTGITRAKNNVLIVSNKTTPYQGKITLLEDAAVQINQSTGVDTKLAKFYESLTPSQIEKLGVDSAQALQEKYDNLAFADVENTYTIEDFILDQTEKCKL